jgi:hypothetical protein
MAVHSPIRKPYFELMNAINASISSSARCRFGIPVSALTNVGSFNLNCNASGLAENLERFGAPSSIVQYSDALAALLL